ncbi:MAG: IS4 family transposase [Francisellaceae bacterium]
MRHIKELQQLLSTYFPFFPHKLQCLSGFILGLMIVKCVNLSKIASTFQTETKKDSTYKRLQRFIKGLNVTPGQLLNMIFDVFQLEGKKLHLCMDRTNWKFGKIHINYLVISIAYKGIATPVIWSLLIDKKCGNSNFDDRRRLIDRLLTFLDPSRIEVILADREFLSEDTIAYLHSKNIPFVIRAKENFVTCNSQGFTVSLAQVFETLPPGKTKHLKHQRSLLGSDVYISAKRLKDGELLILVSKHRFNDVFDKYKIRWEIETLFSAVKKRGFDLESTHIVKPERLSNLFFVVSIAFIWGYRQGDIIVAAKPHLLKPKKHGYPQHSIVRIGIDAITKAISLITIKPRNIIASMRMVFKQSSSKAGIQKWLSVL